MNELALVIEGIGIRACPEVAWFVSPQVPVIIDECENSYVELTTLK